MYLLEALAEGRYIQPSFLVDVHAPSVQGLYYGLGLREKKVVATSSTFSDSNVLNTMKGLCMVAKTCMRRLFFFHFIIPFPHFSYASVAFTSALVASKHFHSFSFFILYSVFCFLFWQTIPFPFLCSPSFFLHYYAITILLAEVYRIISFFALDGELLALAGGGVMPPIPPSVKAPKIKHAPDTVSESGALFYLSFLLYHALI